MKDDDTLLNFKIKIQNQQKEQAELQNEYRLRSKAWRKWSWNASDRINALEKEIKSDFSRLLHAIKPNKKK